MIVPLKQFLSPIGIYQPEKVFRVKKSAGVASLILGFVTVFLGNFELGIGNESGMPLIFFGSTAFSAIEFALLIEWKSDHVKRIYREWILPGILGSLLLVPIGIINGNDYAIFLLIVLPTILGAAFFATHEFPWPKFSNHEG